MCTECKKNTVFWLSFEFVQIVNFAFTRVALLSFERRISRQQCVTRGKKGKKCTCTNTCLYSTRLISIYLPSILVSGGVTQEIFTVVAKRLDSSLRRDVLRIGGMDNSNWALPFLETFKFEHVCDWFANCDTYWPFHACSNLIFGMIV